MSEAAGPAGLAMEFVGTIMGGAEQNRAARAQARVDEENARRKILQGEYDAQQTRRDEAAVSAAQLVASGGNGLMLEGGSLADLLAQNAVQREFEILNIRTRAVDEANNLYTSADEQRRAGRSALIGSVFGAVSGAIKGASALRQQGRVGRQRETERKYMTGGGTQLTSRAPRVRVTGPPL